MNVVSYASLVFLIVCMFTCSFVVDRYVKRSHDDDNFPVLPSAVIFLNLFVSVVVAFVNLEWGQPVSWVRDCCLSRRCQFHDLATISLARCPRKRARQFQSTRFIESPGAGLEPLSSASKIFVIAQSTMRTNSLRKTLMTFS